MSLPKVFVTRALPEGGLNPLLSHAEIEIWPERQPPPYEVLLEKVRFVDGLLCLLTDRIDKNLIEAAPSLKVISQMAVGYDNIDIAAATTRKIPVGNTPGVLTDATADLTWALLMTISRRIIEAENFVRAGSWKTWDPTLLLGLDLCGATLGIIGFGRIGQGVARRAKGFDMRVIYYSPHRKNPDLETSLGVEYRELNQLLQESDFVSLHAALSPQTHHLISYPQFALMKRSSILINTARGSIVDSKALYQALKSGQIAGAAIDVTEPEPIPKDDPLLSLNNLIITPHIGSASYQTRLKMATMAAENLLAGLLNQPLPYCVNPFETGHKSPFQKRTSVQSRRSEARNF